jgi:hypothetical protein
VAFRCCDVTNRQIKYEVRKARQIDVNCFLLGWRDCQVLGDYMPLIVTLRLGLICSDCC